MIYFIMEYLLALKKGQTMATSKNLDKSHGQNVEQKG